MSLPARAAAGVTLTEKWNTDNSLTTEVVAIDQVAKGTKITLDSCFSPNSGFVGGR